MKNQYLLLIFMIVLFSVKTFAQNEIPLLPADTFAISQNLKQAEIHKKHGDKKEESRFYDEIAFIYWEHNMYQKAIDFYLHSIKLNEELNNLSGASMINHNIGMIYSDMAKYSEALSYFQKSLDYRRMVKDKTGTIMVLINMSVVLNNLKQFDESIRRLNEALSLARELNDMEQMKSCYGMLSETYEKAKQSDKATYYFELYKTFHEKLQEQKVKKAEQNVAETQLKLQLTESEKRNKELELRLTNKELADKEKDLMNLDSANRQILKNLTKSELQKKVLEQDAQLKDLKLKEAQSARQKQSIQIIFLFTAIILTLILFIGLAYFYRQKHKTNLQLMSFNDQIFEQNKEIEAKNQIVHDQNNKLSLQTIELSEYIEELRTLNETIEERNLMLEKLSLAASQTDNAIMITSNTGDIEWINEGFTKIYGYTIDEFLKRGKNIIEASSDAEAIYPILKAINQKSSKIYEAEIETKSGKKVWIQTTVTPVIDSKNAEIKKMVFIDSDISKLKESERKIKEQKQQIENHQKALTDSINYAQLIQEAMLTRGKEIKTHFNNSFILYKPKAIVSGDFYWCAKVQDFIMVAAVDCTGHGVPGAFMSMIGMNLLNQITEVLYLPNEILYEMDKGIRLSLNQDNNKNEDGMDAVVCTFDLSRKKLYYSGASRPMILIQNDNIEQINGDKFTIGGRVLRSKTHTHTCRTFDLVENTYVYLFSDGITDQFSSKTGKKFSFNRLLDTITQNYKKTFNEQYTIFDSELTAWQGTEKQTDDMMLIGIKY